ncbi:MAG: VWA domain-containing protein [Halioglobus sp.]
MELLSNFHLMRPDWLWALLPAGLLILLLWRQRNRSGGWSDVIAPELLPFLVGKSVAARGPNLLPFILLAWVVAVLAASGPAWNKLPQPIHQKRDAMVMVMDLSYSMLATDLAPSRLNRARQKLLDLLKLRMEGQTGLIAYAGDAHIVTPLTDDNLTIANLLPVLSPLMMPVPGSNSPAAIRQAVQLMHSAGISQGRILLLTDGVDDEAGKEIGKIISGSGMQLHVMGVGTANGAPIPLPKGGFLKDGSNTIVIPKLDSRALAGLARDNGGHYVSIQLDNDDLDQILNAPLSVTDDNQTLATDRTADTWNDQGYLLVLFLVPLVLPLFRRGLILSLLPLILLATPEQATAQSWDELWLTPDQQGQRAIQQGDNAGAAKLFDNPAWAGTAAYRGEDYEAADEYFAKGENSDDWYNRGNALARAGKLDEAITAYKESLALDPDKSDAAENLALLEQLKQQQEQEQEQQDNEDQEQDGENQDEQQQQDSSGDQQDQESDDEPSEQPGGDEQQDNDEPSPEDQPQNDQDEQQPGDEQEQEPAPEQDSPKEETEQEAEAAAAESEPTDPEQDQAMEQWLRRVPDDPSGLLREKFRYESRQRQENGEQRDNETYW